MIPHLLSVTAIFGALALSLNLVVGVAGLFNLGHAAFFCIGSYTSALLALAGWPWWACFLASGVTGALAGLLVGLPTLRLRGDYLAMVTLGFGEIVRAVARNWVGLTRGPMGLPGIPRPEILGVRFDTPVSLLVLSWVFLALVFVVAELIVRSPFGRVLRGIREDEVVVAASGRSPFEYRLRILAVGAGLAGLSGSMYAHYVAFVDPSTYTLALTIFVFLLVVLGGLGSNLGALVAALVLVVGRESLRFLGLPPAIGAPLQQLVFGLLLVALVIYRPRGLVPEARTVTRVAARRP